MSGLITLLLNVALLGVGHGWLAACMLPVNALLNGYPVLLQRLHQVRTSRILAR